MKILRILSSAAGAALAVNAVPHGVSGVQGRRFPTPFATPPGQGLSSPTQNVLWSGINLGLAALLLRTRERGTPGVLAAAAGAAGMGFYLASYFGSLESLRSPDTAAAPDAR